MHAATAAAHEREEGPGLPVSAGNGGLQAPPLWSPLPTASIAAGRPSRTSLRSLLRFVVL
jgi:hypothetical protein